MKKSRVVGDTSEKAAPALLAAADDDRLRSRRIALVVLVGSIILALSSLLLWPRGLYALVMTADPAQAWLITSGLLLLAMGALGGSVSARRLGQLNNRHSSTGKAHSAFGNELDYGLPQIGQGHGGPMDASAAQFANPDKVLRGRDQ